MGVRTATTRSGAIITQAVVVSEVLRSSATTGSEALSTVTGKLVAATPINVTIRIVFRDGEYVFWEFMYL